MIRRILFAAAAITAIGIAAAPEPAAARSHVSFSVGVGGPGWYGWGGGWRPYRHYWGGPSVAIGVPLYGPPPVYYDPPPYYAPPPAYYAPAPAPAYAPAPYGAYAPQPVAQVLETVPTGSSATVAGQVTTPTRTWQNGQTWCREYTTTGRIGGRTEQLVGTACRDPGGAWRVAQS